jgi:NAD(P)-dependent dehydrogenase (short-subunit alcohol dehydrogenase family)
MPIEIDLSGRVALITGGTKGVGLGIARRLVDAGAAVVVCGRTAPAEGSLPAGIEFLAADVRDADAVAALVAEVVERHGRLDIAVNNAGGSPTSDPATASPRFSEKVVALNLTAALHLAQAANAVMQGQDGGGSIVNITSMSGLRASPTTVAYGAAKAGLVNLTESLAMAWAPKVRVNAVSPGIVRTESFESYYGEDAASRAGATVPLGRIAEPTDVGDAVAFLASPLASFVSGANLVLHGGGEYLALADLVEP